MSTMLLAFGLGTLGLLANCLIIWLAAGVLSSFDMRFVFLSSMLPIIFITQCLKVFDKREAISGNGDIYSRNEIIGLALIGGVFVSLVIYLSFVITTVIWSAGANDAFLAKFLQGVFDPSSLPSLYESRRSGKQTELSQGFWVFMAAWFFFIGAFVTFKFIPRRKN